MCVNSSGCPCFIDERLEPKEVKYPPVKSVTEHVISNPRIGKAPGKRNWVVQRHFPSGRQIHFKSRTCGSRAVVCREKFNNQRGGLGPDLELWFPECKHSPCGLLHPVSDVTEGQVGKTCEPWVLQSQWALAATEAPLVDGMWKGSSFLPTPAYSTVSNLSLRLKWLFLNESFLFGTLALSPLENSIHTSPSTSLPHPAI